MDRGLQLLSRCFDIWVGSHTKKSHTTKPAHDVKVSNVTIAHPDISKSQKIPTTPTFQRRFPSRNTGQPDNPLGVVPKPAIDPIRAQQVWKEKARAPHLFRFLWELYKCLINKKVGWLWKIAICLIFEMLSLWNSGFLFEHFGGFMFHRAVPPKNTYRSKGFRFYVGFLVGIFFFRRRFSKEVRFHEAAILGSGMGLFISLA